MAFGICFFITFAAVSRISTLILYRYQYLFLRLKTMKNRKLVLSLVALAGLSSLSAQAQTNNTEKPHETIMQRVDTLAKKVGADVKHAEGVES